MQRSLMVILLLGAWTAWAEEVARPYFGIQVVDEATGVGVPLVELRTVNDISFHTDSDGWIAFHEPELMDREVYFGVSGPGYEYPADGFGSRGVRLKTMSGKSASVKIKRTNIAERMYRVTGQGIRRDSELLDAVGDNVPRANVLVVGQDSVQAVPYRDRIFWLWGDTNLANYPLGNFNTTAATSPLPGKDFNRELGVPLTYFTDAKQPERVRGMVPSREPGPVWLFGLLTIADPEGQEALLAHYTRRKSLAEEAEHGLVRFNDGTGLFDKIVELDLDEKWRFPNGNAVRVKQHDGEYFYFSGPFAQVRVRADWHSVIDPKAYEALSYDVQKKAYRWQRELPATTQAEERRLLDSGQLKLADAGYQIIDVASDKPIRGLHHSSIAWNEYRRKWILIGVQQDFANKPSHLGEVWYAEADDIAGPWRKAIKIATHPNYSFYNPRQHTFMDEENGRFIYFEGTYTRTFSGNPIATPRYEYNQLMYRLDLSDERFKALQ